MLILSKNEKNMIFMTNKNIGVIKRLAKSSFKKLVKEYLTLHENYGQSVITKIMNKASKKTYRIRNDL